MRMDAIVGSTGDYARDGFRHALMTAGFDVTREIVSRRGTRQVLGGAQADVVVLDGTIVSVDGPSAEFARFERMGLVLVIDPSDRADVAQLIKIGFRGLVDATATRSSLGPAAIAVAAGQLCFARPFAEDLVAAPQKAGQLPRLPTGDLTERQLDVLNLVVRGKSNNEIASQLGIAASTARFHVSAIWRRTGLKSRRELMAWLSRSELLDA
jgi:DNA-binding NarL/FixJ family response regulator